MRLHPNGPEETPKSLRYTLSMAALSMAALTAPFVLMLVAMGLGAPGATWGWLHTIVSGLTLTLLLVSATAFYAARSGRDWPLYIALLLFGSDFTIIAWNFYWA